MRTSGILVLAIFFTTTQCMDRVWPAPIGAPKQSDRKHSDEKKSEKPTQLGSKKSAFQSTAAAVSNLFNGNSDHKKQAPTTTPIVLDYKRPVQKKPRERTNSLYVNTDFDNSDSDLTGSDTEGAQPKSACVALDAKSRSTSPATESQDY